MQTMIVTSKQMLNYLINDCFESAAIRYTQLRRGHTASELNNDLNKFFNLDQPIATIIMCLSLGLIQVWTLMCIFNNYICYTQVRLGQMGNTLNTAFSKKNLLV